MTADRDDASAKRTPIGVAGMRPAKSLKPNSDAMSLEKAPASQARKCERGMALLVVLWGVTAAALLVSAFNVVARSGATFVASELALTEAEALADAGL